MQFKPGVKMLVESCVMLSWFHSLWRGLVQCGISEHETPPVQQLGKVQSFQEQNM